MNCAMCSQSDVDGAMDSHGDYVCVDCWASGEAAHEGRTAKAFVPAATSYDVHYPAEMKQRFLDACNRKGR